MAGKWWIHLQMMDMQVPGLGALRFLAVHLEASFRGAAQEHYHSQTATIGVGSAVPVGT